MNLQCSITLKNDLKEIENLVDIVKAACEVAKFDELTTDQMNLVLEEAVVNVINYGYPEGTEGDIVVDVEVGDGCLTFTVSDHGVAFDPTKHGDVDTTLPAEQRQIGGLGIFLMKTTMDDVSYQRKDGQNILKLKKFYKQ